MKSFRIVMDHEFLNHRLHVPCSEKHEVIEAFISNCPNESFYMGIAVGTLGRNFHAFHSTRFQNPDEGIGLQRVAVVYQTLRLAEKAIHRINEISRDLFHPFPWCPKIHRHQLRRLPIVVIQQSTEA